MWLMFFCFCSSPQGRIFQVEYAQEAVKQGSVVVGLVSKTHAVLVGLKVNNQPSFLFLFRLTRCDDCSVTQRNCRRTRKK